MFKVDNMVGTFVCCSSSMMMWLLVCNVDEMMVHLYDSLHIYGWWVCSSFFEFQPYPNVKCVMMESVHIHVSTYLVPKKAHLLHLFNPSSKTQFSPLWLITPLLCLCANFSPLLPFLFSSLWLITILLCICDKFFISPPSMYCQPTHRSNALPVQHTCGRHPTHWGWCIGSQRTSWQCTGGQRTSTIDYVHALYHIAKSSVCTSFSPPPCQSSHLHPCPMPCPEVFFAFDAIIVILQMMAKAVEVLHSIWDTAKLPPKNLTLVNTTILALILFLSC